jgi:hypothetical protein
MNVFVFSSKTITNIWAGVGSGRWAVSKATAEMAQVKAGAKVLPVGALGLFYCTEAKAFTTPFMVLTEPEQKTPDAGIWSGEWHLPFSIHPLGSPRLLMPIERALNILPTMKAAGKSKWTHVIHYQPTTAFRPTSLTDEDWEWIVRELIPSPE